MEILSIAALPRGNERAVRLTRKERELLAVLVQNAGELMNREDLLMRVWGYGPQIRTRTLDVHIRRLRKKLGHPADAHIETIFGVGYRYQTHRSSQFPLPRVTMKLPMARRSVCSPG